jgi:predicted FMN-binding regulatory protein PaiB
MYVRVKWFSVKFKNGNVCHTWTYLSFMNNGCRKTIVNSGAIGVDVIGSSTTTTNTHFESPIA